MKFFTFPGKSLSFQYTVRVNCAPQSMRQKIADFLRYGASKIDSRLSLTVEITSTPALSAAQKAECLNFGARAIAQAVPILAKSQALEDEMERYAPSLFKKNTHQIPSKST